jgi:type I restriction enzyme S subunit
MKQDWEIKSLGEIADVEYGFTDKSTGDGDYRYVRITDIDNNGELILTDKKYLKHSKEAKGFLIRDNDLLMARTGATFAKVLLYRDFEPSVFASYLIRINFKEKIENKLYWYFTKTKSYWDQANSLASGAAQPHFNGAAVKQVIFPYPKSLPEQQRIVAILDTAFAAIAKAKANAEQNLKNVKELFESYLQGVFENKGEGWVNSTIGESCNLQTGGTPSTSKKEFYEDGVIKWLVSGDINQKVINDCVGRITELGMNNSNTKYLPINSVLIALNGQGKTRGTVAMLRTKATCNQSLVSIYPKDDKSLMPELVFSNLEGRYDEIRKMTGDSGNDRRGLNMPLIRSIKFSYPKKLTEQKNIIIKLDALRSETKKLEIIYQQKIKDLEELKKSVLQKAFAGELKTATVCV